MNIIDEIYYEQNPDLLEQRWREYLEEYGLTEDQFTFAEYCNEI